MAEQITKVRRSGNRIDECQLRNGRRVSKKVVINDLKNHPHSYETYDPNGHRRRVDVVDGKYLRSDRNNTRADNLDELPTY